MTQHAWCFHSPQLTCIHASQSHILHSVTITIPSCLFTPVHHLRCLSIHAANTWRGHTASVHFLSAIKAHSVPHHGSSSQTTHSLPFNYPIIKDKSCFLIFLILEITLLLNPPILHLSQCNLMSCPHPLAPQATPISTLLSWLMRLCQLVSLILLRTNLNLETVSKTCNKIFMVLQR